MGFGGSGGDFWDLRDLRGGGYLGIGIGGDGVAGLTAGLEGGGVEGKDEKRLRPGSDATITMEVLEEEIEFSLSYL